MYELCSADARSLGVVLQTNSFLPWVARYSSWCHPGMSLMLICVLLSLPHNSCKTIFYPGKWIRWPDGETAIAQGLCKYCRNPRHHPGLLTKFHTSTSVAAEGGRPVLAGLSVVGDVGLTPRSGSNLVLTRVSQPACALALSVIAWGYKHQESHKKWGKDHRTP